MNRLFFELLYSLIPFKQILFELINLILELCFLFKQNLISLLQFIVFAVDLFQIDDIFITNFGKFFLKSLNFQVQIVHFSLIFMTLLALLILFMQNLESFDISFLKLFAVVRLESNQRLNVTLYLPYHQV